MQPGWPGPAPRSLGPRGGVPGWVRPANVYHSTQDTRLVHEASGKPQAPRTKVLGISAHKQEGSWMGWPAPRYTHTHSLPDTHWDPGRAGRPGADMITGGGRQGRHPPDPGRPWPTLAGCGQAAPPGEPELATLRRQAPASGNTPARALRAPLSQTGNWQHE